MNEIICGDCKEVLKDYDDNMFDTCICDPPYALQFMGKGWDKVLPPIEAWCEILRVLKPGAMLMAFGGTRTYHRLTCAIEDAGFEIRDCVMWVMGQGFPKSLNIGKAIDKLQGNERKELGTKNHGKKDFKDNLYAQALANKNNKKVFGYGKEILTQGNSIWEDYGTALKPAYEPIVLAMKPLDGTFVQNALKWGVAGLWIDGGRIEYQSESDKSSATPQGKCAGKEIKAIGAQPDGGRNLERIGFNRPEQKGRWPSNLIHDGSDEVMRLFPNRKTTWISPKHKNKRDGEGFLGGLNHPGQQGFNDSGSAARFFYTAKASRTERERGLVGHTPCAKCGGVSTEYHVDDKGNKVRCTRNSHPTVKPISLMCYLCRLTRMPTGGIVLDPFAGSGSTCVAATLEGRDYLGIEINTKDCEIARKRITYWGKRQKISDIRI